MLAAEWGSGRRRGWLSNLHLGARSDTGFVMLGKTFKGLTDELLTEIQRVIFLAHPTEERLGATDFDQLLDLRAESARDGIAVTLVCPGFIRTDVSVNALEGDGSRHGVVDRGQARGMDPDECAKRIVRGLDRKRAEVWVGGKEVFAVWVERFCPPLYRWLAQRIDPT